MKIADLMTPTVAACSMTDTLEVAARAMWDYDCGCVPIVDDGGYVIGMVTDRDVCIAAPMPVTSVMGDATIETAELLMRARPAGPPAPGHRPRWPSSESCR